MYIFNLQYQEGVKLEEQDFFGEIVKQTLIHNEVKFEFGETKFPTCKFKDSQGNEWFYSTGIVQINFKEIRIGSYQYSDGRTITRMATKEEVIKKAEEYFLRFAIQKETSEKMFNIRGDDSYFSLN